MVELTSPLQFATGVSVCQFIRDSHAPSRNLPYRTFLPCIWLAPATSRTYRTIPAWPASCLRLRTNMRLGLEALTKHHAVKLMAVEKKKRATPPLLCFLALTK